MTHMGRSIVKNRESRRRTLNAQEQAEEKVIVLPSGGDGMAIKTAYVMSL